jgi:hypothetical protein
MSKHASLLAKSVPWKCGKVVTSIKLGCLYPLITGYILGLMRADSGRVGVRGGVMSKQASLLAKRVPWRFGRVVTPIRSGCLYPLITRYILGLMRARGRRYLLVIQFEYRVW